MSVSVTNYIHMTGRPEAEWEVGMGVEESHTLRIKGESVAVFCTRDQLTQLANALSVYLAPKVEAETAEATLSVVNEKWEVIG